VPPFKYSDYTTEGCYKSEKSSLQTRIKSHHVLESAVYVSAHFTAFSDLLESFRDDRRWRFLEGTPIDCVCSKSTSNPKPLSSLSLDGESNLGEICVLNVVGVIGRQSIFIRTSASIGLITALVLLLAPLQKVVNTTTIGFALLLGVLFIAIHMGSKAALAASVVAMLGYNFFFLPPILTLTISDPQNWIALAAFYVTAFVVGHLSANARQRATEERLPGNKSNVFTWNCMQHSRRQATLKPSSEVN
jgi:Domain of unknown function (DUF4118)